MLLINFPINQLIYFVCPTFGYVTMPVNYEVWMRCSNSFLLLLISIAFYSSYAGLDIDVVNQFILTSMYYFAYMPVKSITSNVVKKRVMDMTYT